MGTFLSAVLYCCNKGTITIWNRSSHTCPLPAVLAVIAVGTGYPLGLLGCLSRGRQRSNCVRTMKPKTARVKPTRRGSNNRTILFILQRKNVYHTRTQHDSHDTPCATAPTEAGAPPANKPFGQAVGVGTAPANQYRLRIITGILVCGH